MRLVGSFSRRPSSSRRRGPRVLPRPLLPLLAVGSALRSTLVRGMDLLESVASAALSLLGALYLGALGGTMAGLRVQDPEGLGGWRIAFLLITVMFSDTAAYFVGCTLGRHRLAPRLSPGKSVEGALGGLAGGVAGALLMRTLGLPASACGPRRRSRRSRRGPRHRWRSGREPAQALGGRQGLGDALPGPRWHAGPARQFAVRSAGPVLLFSVRPLTAPRRRGRFHVWRGGARRTRQVLRPREREGNLHPRLHGFRGPERPPRRPRVPRPLSRRGTRRRCEHRRARGQQIALTARRWFRWRPPRVSRLSADSSICGVSHVASDATAWWPSPHTRRPPWSSPRPWAPWASCPPIAPSRPARTWPSPTRRPWSWRAS